MNLLNKIRNFLNKRKIEERKRIEETIKMCKDFKPEKKESFYSDKEIERALEIARNWNKYSLNEKKRIKAIAYKNTELNSECLFNNSFCSLRLERHHQDYSKPLEIVTLCDSHHQLTHRSLTRLDMILAIERKLNGKL